MNLYVIKDKVANEVGPIFEAKNDEIAKRQLSHLLISADTAVPTDFELWFVGSKFDTIDNEVNCISASETATLVCNGDDISSMIDSFIEYRNKIAQVKEVKNV